MKIYVLLLLISAIAGFSNAAGRDCAKSAPPPPR
jgi:hypothetical protein